MHILIRFCFFLIILSFNHSSFAQTGDTETGAECSNGIDDDGDGFIDENDFDCTETGAECSNGIDDDGDGFIDENDFDCIETGAECSNGIDDDGDGFIDENDFDCTETGAECNNGIDDDGDGFIDENDFDCTETDSECSNGLDDDGDGFIDGDDFDCESLSLNNLNIENSIKIYPNPTIGIFKITNYNVRLKIETIILHNIEGQVILQISNTKSNEIEVDLSQYSRSVYFLTINSNLGKATKLIIKK